MGRQRDRKPFVYLPLVLAATLLVVGVPVLLVFWLRASGVVTSLWAGTLIGVAGSSLLSWGVSAYWKTREDSQGILASELMLWGWVHRWRSERRLVVAADLLGLTTDRPRSVSEGRLTNEQKADLLTQLGTGLEARDPYTHGHSRRVARHAANIAKRMGLPRAEVTKIRAAGTMHDVGKVETPLAVLHKEGKLTDDEYEVVKRHPVDGAAMVSTLDDDELSAMVRHHHERLDGTGYPDGLAGDAIPLGARILAVADTFDAITSTRPYRKAHPHKKALGILEAEAGTQLDPDAVRAFCGCYSGRRPLAYWTILAHARPRFASWFGSGLGSAKAAAANVAASAAAVGGVGGASAAVVEPPVDSHRALSSAARESSAPGSHPKGSGPTRTSSAKRRRTARGPSGDGPPSARGEGRRRKPGAGRAPGRRSAPTRATAPRSGRPGGNGGNGNGAGNNNGNGNGQDKPKPGNGQAKPKPDKKPTKPKPVTADPPPGRVREQKDRRLPKGLLPGAGKLPKPPPEDRDATARKLRSR